MKRQPPRARTRDTRRGARAEAPQVQAASSDDAPIFIDSPARWSAVGSPVRMRILMLLEDGRARRVRDLAASLRRTPQSLYRHLAILRDAGLVEEETDAEGASFRCPRPVKPVGFFEGQPFASAYAHAVERMFREAARVCATVPEVPGLRLRRRTQAWTLRLDDAGVRALNAATERYISEVRRLLREGVGEDGLPVYVVLGVSLDVAEP